MSILKGGTQTVNYLSFDGVNDYIDFGSLSNSISEIYIETEIQFLNISNNSGSKNIISLGSNGTALIGFELRYTETELQFGSYDGSNIHASYSLSNLSENNWYNVKGEYNGTSWKLFVDNIEVANTVSSQGPFLSNDSLSFGSLVLFGDHQRHSNVNMRYTKVLDQNGVIGEWNFNEGTGTTLTDSAGNNDGTIVGATWQETAQTQNLILPSIIDNSYWANPDFEGQTAQLLNANDLFSYPKINISGSNEITTNGNWTYILELDENDTILESHADTCSGSFSSGVGGGFVGTIQLQSNTKFIAITADSRSSSWCPSTQKTTLENLTITYTPSPAIDNIYYGSPSVVYTLDGASYDNVSFNISSQTTGPQGICFNNDGTKMYLNDGGNVFQYTLSTPYNISTATYNNVSFSVSSQDSGSHGITFNDNGSKMYIMGYNTTSVYQYTLSTAFDLSTASYDNISFNVSSQAPQSIEVAFNNDGSKMYVGSRNDNIYQYTLSTAFDISTSVYDNVFLNVGSQEGEHRGVVFNTDGSKMFIVGYSTDNIYQYSLLTGFDLSTASYDNVSYSLSSQDGVPNDIVFNDNGSKFYILGAQNDAIYQYSMVEQTIYPTIDRVYAGGTLVYEQAPEPFVLGNITYDNISFTSNRTNSFSFTFNNDGSKLYIISFTLDTIYQYSLSTPYNVGTSSYDNISLSGLDEITNAKFNNDGTKLYTYDYGPDIISQYSLATPYNIGTATSDNKTFSASLNNGFGFIFNNDGSKMFLSGADDFVQQYSLSTPFDISTSSYDNKNFQFDNDAISIQFNNDGSKLFILSQQNNLLKQYSLPNKYDLSGITFDNVQFDLTPPSTSDPIHEFAFNNDGTKIYAIIPSEGKVYQYTND